MHCCFNNQLFVPCASFIVALFGMSAEGEIVTAASEGDVAKVRSLLNSGVHADYATTRGETALMAAVRGGYIAIVRLLVEEAGANVNIRFQQCGDGWTALMYAGFYGRISIIRYLLESGADYTLRNSDGLTVLDIVPCMNASLTEVQEAVSLGQQSRDACAKYEPVTVSCGNVVPYQRPNQPLSSNVSGFASPRGDDNSGLSSSSSSALASGVFDGRSTSSLASAAADDMSKWVGAMGQANTSSLDVPDIATAQPRLIEVYHAICGDFGLEPMPQVIAAILNASADKDGSGLGTLSFGGPRMNRPEGLKEAIHDVGIIPLLEALNTSFQNAPFHTLDLSYMNLTDKVAFPIGVYVAHSPVLISLDLTGNDFTEAGAAHLAKAFSMNPRLQVIRLSRNPLGDLGAGFIAESIAYSPSLHTLDLTNTEVGISCMIKLASIIQRVDSPLTCLMLGNTLVKSLGEEGIIHIAKALPRVQLVGLSLAKNRITDLGAEWIADHLSKNSTISELDLSSNAITVTGVTMIARALQQRPCECIVILDGNPLTDQLLDELYDVLEAGQTGWSGKAGKGGKGTRTSGDYNDSKVYGVDNGDGGYGYGDNEDDFGNRFGSQVRPKVTFVSGQAEHPDLVDRYKQHRHFLFAKLPAQDGTDPEAS